MNEETSEKETFRREMFTHVQNVRDRCERMILANDPYEVYNNVQAMRSIVGQMEKAAVQWRLSKM